MAKILIVDDHPANRELVAALIKRGGHEALEAADGAEALALVRAQHPQLVISDILMPTMDGYEFVRQLRADPALANTEVIFYSAHYREREARNLAKACGVSRVLLKPCKNEDIVQAINQALGHAPLPTPMPVTQNFNGEHLRLMSDKLSEKVLDLERANRRLAALTDLHLQLTPERDPKVLLDAVCRGARDLIGAKYAVLGVSGKNDAEAVFYTSGIDPALVARLEQPQIDQGLLGAVRSDHRSRRMLNPAGDPMAVGLPPGYPPLHACLVAAVTSTSHAFGWICLADKLGAGEFTQDDEQLLSILGAQVGRFYESGSVYAEVQQHARQLELDIAERQTTLEVHRTNEAGLRRAQLLAKLTHVITGMDGSFESWPETMPLMLGIDPALMPRTTRDWLGLVHPADRERFRAVAAEAGVRGTGAESIEYRLRRADGTWLHVRQVMEPLEGPIGAHARGRWFNTIQDVTGQKQAESRIRRLNRVYAVLSGINALIVRTIHRDDLFTQACRIAVEDGHFKTAWIGVVDREAMMIVPAASAGAEPEFLSFIKDRFTLREDGPMGNTMSARAVREKKPFVSNQIREDSELLFSTEHVGGEILSMAFLPLLVSDQAAGVFALYADEAGFFDADEMKLLLELAGDIGFALDHIEKSERLNYLAYYDELTGLPNRTLFLERVSQQLLPRDGVTNLTALALVDIERFRSINDTLGRQTGDELLKLIANRMRASEVGLDAVGRVGSDSFGVLVNAPRDAAAAALTLDELLRVCFATPFHLQGADLRIAAKAGVAVHPLDGGDAETLLRNAEAALERAKGGAETLMFYTPEMNRHVAETLNLESKLRTALALDQFVLHYQPKVSLASGKLTGAEALIRWDDPQSGLVPPGQFIPILEETGLIYQVGRWALRQALADNMRWRAAGLSPVRTAVNVSPLQLRHSGFVSEVEQAVSISEGAAAGLELEITESLVMEDVQRNRANLLAIRGMGVRIAIDDFGTGYSSLGHLSKLPFDTLKIDRSFVIDMVAGPQGLALVSTIVNLAHALDLTVVAEGVETEEQARLLRLLKCDEMQGYLVSKPVPAEIFEQRFLKA